MLNSLFTISRQEDGSNKRQATKTAEPSEAKIRVVAGSHINKKYALLLFRVLILDIPLIALLSLYATTEVLLHCNDQYWEPLVHVLLPWRNRIHRRASEVTYYGRVCTENDQTASSPEELMITPDMTDDDAADNMLKHGISIFPDLLKPETAAALRDTIIEHNYIEDNFHVLRPENRYSYGIRVEQHLSVRQAIHEISTHPVLQPAMKKVIGEHQAVYKFHAITSDFGADDQEFHWDVVPLSSAAMFARSFVPIYSLFIPLQNTTADMGSTEICPGTHICTAGTKFCRKTAFRASGEADNWPAGSGALMNQQTTHRGRAHVNPDSGPRVLFILAFTPTPRHDHPHQLETRILSLGGSYAVHWTQWGHTEWDLQDSWSRMKMPWKLLRSLGIYKPKHAVWGWDWVTSVLIQVANGDYYHRDELQAYAAGGGFSPIPEHLLPKMPDKKYTRGMAWYSYVVELIKNCKRYFRKLIEMMLLTYFGVTLCWQGCQYHNGKSFCRNIAKSSIVLLLRVLLMFAVISAVYLHITQSIANTQWASQIRSRKLYQLSQNFRGPRLPSVLPLEKDFLLMEDMQSEYLASYTRLYEVAHPGNAAWKEMVSKNAVGYSNLNSPLRQQLRDSLFLWNRQKQSRMLLKNHLNQWAEMTRDMADEFVHNQLMRQDVPSIANALQNLDYLWSETKFGPWRDTSLHETHIPALLMSLEEQLLDMPRKDEAAAMELTPYVIPSYRIRSYSLQKDLSSTAGATTTGSRNNGIPPVDKNIAEPFVGAWLRVGDDVEGRYKGKHNEWYRGRIVAASAFDLSWTVEYYDGEHDTSLCRYCVRPFHDYQVGEVIEYMATPQDDWHEARIAAMKYNEHGDTLQYDFVHSAPDDAVYARYKIIPSDMRRFKPTLAQDRHFVVGQHVEARYYDDADEHDGQWYLGWIVAANKSKDRTTYNVEYLDGSDQSDLWEEDLRAL